MFVTKVKHSDTHGRVWFGSSYFESDSINHWESVVGEDRVFDATLTPDAPTAEECEAVAALEAEKYLDAQWVHQTPEVADHIGAVRVKTPAGLLDVRVVLAGAMIKAAFIAGDFIASDSAVAAMEAGLRWHTAEPSTVTATLQKLHGEWQDGLGGIPLDGLSGAVNGAVQQALSGDASQYGCFVNPQGQ